MTDTPLPFEEEVENLFDTYDVQVQQRGAVLEMFKAALLAAHKKEMRRVIGERQLGTSIDMPANATQVQALMEGQTYSPHIVARNNLRHEQYKRAGIAPEEK